MILIYSRTWGMLGRPSDRQGNNALHSDAANCARERRRWTEMKVLALTGTTVLKLDVTLGEETCVIPFTPQSRGSNGGRFRLV